MDNQTVPKQRFKLDRKELMYGLIVIFLLFIMYYLGQLATHSMLEEVRAVCPKLQVTTISPFGISYVSKGQITYPNGTPYIPDSSVVIPSIG